MLQAILSASPVGHYSIGAKTIWLGMQEIADFVEGARYARQFNDG